MRATHHASCSAAHAPCSFKFITYRTLLQINSFSQRICHEDISNNKETIARCVKQFKSKLPTVLVYNFARTVNFYLSFENFFCKTVKLAVVSSILLAKLTVECWSVTLINFDQKVNQEATYEGHSNFRIDGRPIFFVIHVQQLSKLLNYVSIINRQQRQHGQLFSIGFLKSFATQSIVNRKLVTALSIRVSSALVDTDRKYKLSLSKELYVIYMCHSVAKWQISIVWM